MAEQNRSSYNYRQGISFDTDNVPNFLKRIRQEHEPPKEKEKPEREERDDEAPVYVLEVGVTSKEAKDLLGVDLKVKDLSQDQVSRNKIQEAGSVKKKQKIKTVSKSKGVKNSNLLSFDE